MPYIDIIIFAIIAVLLVFRLRSVLGQRTGYEEQTPPPAMQDNEPIPLHPDRMPAKSDDGHGVDAIRAADRSFSEKEFLQGANAAFGMILTAYAEGDIAQLKRLLSYDLLQSFTKSIQQRQADKESLTIQLGEMKEISILNAQLFDNVASVTVHFHSVQTRTLTDEDGNVIDEEDSGMRDIIDIWTFERDLTLGDPNWKLAETETPEDEE